MKKIMKYTDFVKEMVEFDENIEMGEEIIQNEIPQEDGYVQDEYEDDAQPEFVQDDGPSDEDSEPEEVTDLIELKYDKEIGEWEIDGELDLPSDFDAFYDWFIDEVDEENSTASIKEEGDEIVFHVPEDLYVTYLEEIEKGLPDEMVEIEDFDV